MTSTAASGLPGISSRYALRLILALACGGLAAAALVLLNPDPGVFTVLMLATIAAVGIAGSYLSVQSIRKREPFPWVGYPFLVSLLAAIVWAAVDM
jgi:hypothetical protein